MSITKRKHSKRTVDSEVKRQDEMLRVEIEKRNHPTWNGDPLALLRLAEAASRDARDFNVKRGKDGKKLPEANGPSQSTEWLELADRTLSTLKRNLPPEQFQQVQDFGYALIRAQEALKAEGRFESYYTQLVENGQEETGAKSQDILSKLIMKALKEKPNMGQREFVEWLKQQLSDREIKDIKTGKVSVDKWLDLEGTEHMVKIAGSGEKLTLSIGGRDFGRIRKRIWEVKHTASKQS